jgi:ADP-heptose:LPS heptosyltransferase
MTLKEIPSRAFNYYRKFGLMSLLKKAHPKLGYTELKKEVPISIKSPQYILLSNLENAVPYDRHMFKQLPKQNQYLSIAYIRIGGVGDSLMATAVLPEIQKKYPNSKICLFLRDKNGADLVSGNPHVFKTFVVNGSYNHGELIDSCNQIFDIVFHDQYVIQVLYNIKKLSLFDKDREITDKLFLKYKLNFDTFPNHNSKLLVFEKNIYELASGSTGLNINPENLLIILGEEDFRVASSLDHIRYVTTSCGQDPHMVKNTSRKRQTREWDPRKLNGVVEYLKNNDIEVVQLGNKHDPLIEGTIDLRGITKLKEAAAIIKKALFHLGTDSGLMHIAKAVGTKSIILFGPSSLEFCGYKDNINIKKGICHDCWWDIPDWSVRCKLGLEVPVCMDKIEVEDVKEAIDKLLDTKK